MWGSPTTKSTAKPLVEKTRLWQTGMNTVVLMPFPEANSAEHLTATRGTNMSQSLNLLMASSLQFGGKSATQSSSNEQSTGTGGDMWNGGWNVFNTLRADPNRDVVCIDSPGVKTALARLRGEGDVLYIRGHGSAGGNTLESSDHTRTITITDLASFLSNNIEHDFRGIIKIYACESGTDWSTPVLNWFGLGIWEAFAQQFADAMYAAGFMDCRFFGYGAKVTTPTWSPAQSGGRIDGSSHSSGSGHKYAIIEKNKAVRASQRRREFFPKKKPKGDDII